MNYGQWNDLELQRAKNKVQKYLHLYETCWELVKQINERTYSDYCLSTKNKSFAFGLIPSPVMEKDKFFNKVTTHVLEDSNQERVYVPMKDQNNLWKFDLTLSESEYLLMDFFWSEVAFNYSFKKDIDQFEKRLTYCTGGVIETDEVYLLCDLDINITTLDSNIKNYKERTSE